MKLIVDSNILFTFFWRNSVTRELFLQKRIDFASPEFALEEIKKYKSEILEKTNLSAEEFNGMRKELINIVDFIPLEFYQEFLTNSKDLSPDSNDIDFFALSLKLSCPIWSNDSQFKKQGEITVFNTQEIIELLNEIN